MAAARGPRARPGVLDIAPYVPGTSALPGAHPVIKLSSNETPFGPSPRAIEAYLAAAQNLSRYPDGSARALREAIAKLYGLDPGRIVCGAGSDELLNLLAGAYLGPGDEAIYSAHGFLVYKIAILARGATPVVAPETDLTANVDAILACVSPRTRLVFIANPNNPTGTYLPFDEVKRLREGSAARGAARARCGLRRICAAERLRGRHRAGRHHRQHGDDAHLLQDLRARLSQARLGLLPDRRSPRRSTASEVRSMSRGRPSTRAWPRSPIRPGCSSAPSITSCGAAAWPRRCRSLALA